MKQYERYVLSFYAIITLSNKKKLHWRCANLWLDKQSLVYLPLLFITYSEYTVITSNTPVYHLHSPDSMPHSMQQIQQLIRPYENKETINL
jgi:hypothetical protein